jgi:hypothetical protein
MTRLESAATRVTYPCIRSEFTSQVLSTRSF